MNAMKRYIITAMAVGATLGLSAQVQNLVVVGTDGTKTRINRENIQEITFSEAPKYTEANTLLGTLYTTKDGKASYQIDFATGEPDAEGEPKAEGDFQISLTLTGEPSADALQAAIPAGYYRVGNGSELMTFDVQKSGMWMRSSAESVDMSLFLDGTVDVRYDNGDYDIRCELVRMDGGTINASYSGKIQFTVGSSEYEGFTEPQDIAFEGGQGRFYANWYAPFADDASLQFYTGEFDSSGSQVEGYWLTVSIYMPKVADPMNSTQKVADGVYRIERRDDVASYTYLPYTFEKGSSFEVWGTVYHSGTYITYMDKSGARKIALLTDGTITVSGNGTEFAFDLVSSEGIAFTGTCKGMSLVNYCDNDEKEPKRPYSTIGTDYALDFPSVAEGVAYNLEDYIVEGLNVFTVRFADPAYKTGDYLSLDVLAKGDRLPDGTYPVNNSLEENTVLIGCASATGQPLFSWFADLDSTDDEGYQSVMAPINGGSFTIASQSDGTSKVDFDFLDDKGNRIAGSWTGKIDYPVIDAAGAASQKARLRTSGKAVK